MTTFYTLRFDSPNLEDQVHVFVSPRNRVAQLYPRALGSIFVASYDSQGYGGGIRPRLQNGRWSLFYIYIASERTKQKTPFNISYTVAYVSVAAITWRLLSHCIGTGLFTEPFPSNGCLCWLHNSGFQQTCHIINEHLHIRWTLNINLIVSSQPVHSFVVVQAESTYSLIRSFRDHKTTPVMGKAI
jgi:hypothetical protein